MPAMPTLIPQPTRIAPAGNQPKLIDEFVGRVNSSTADCSLARMQSPAGWREPGQTPEFDEYTIVLKLCYISANDFECLLYTFTRF